MHGGGPHALPARPSANPVQSCPRRVHPPHPPHAKVLQLRQVQHWFPVADSNHIAVSGADI
eukprot:12896930-Prorocentrum_lima.AAC.1